MNLDSQILMKCSLGFLFGISLGVLLRFFMFRILLYTALPIFTMFILDYTGMFSIDWLFLKEKWDKIFVFLTPTAISIYSYLSNHILIGLIPGMLIGLTSGFFFMKR